MSAQEFGSPSADLMDADTAEYIGRATAAQVEASDRAAEKDGGAGIILVDANGDVCPEGSWEAQSPGVRRAYTETSADLLFGFGTKGPR